MLKSSRDSHVMQCFKYSKAKLRRLHYKSPIWKDHHKNLVQKNAANKISLTNMELAAYNAQRGVNAFRFPRELHGSCAWFGCDVCTVLFQPFSGLKAHKCPGPEGRAKVLITGGRRRFWYKLRMRKNQEGAKLLAHHWKLSQDEVAILEKTWDTMSKKPTPAASQWIRDLTMEGIHPHPGPSRALRFCLINSNGRENTWALARWAVSDRIEMCVIAEHCMLPQHQADLARYLLLKGYRSWFVAPPAVQNVKGQWYTSGGVAVFVRSDKPCREIQQCITPDGQAIMMQLDHAYVIGTYIPPRNNTQDLDILATLDDWIKSLGPLQPVVLCGDFNQEPDLATRWTNLSEGGAVSAVADADGSYLPTRWEGRRCIDWAWVSHPHMVSALRFPDFSLSDHRAVEFQLTYDQACVRLFKHVPTKKLTKPDNLEQHIWVEAVSKAWGEVRCPECSNTEQEWLEFCQSAEEAHARALQACGLQDERPARNVRPKGSRMQVQEYQPKTFRLKQNCGFRELKLRKLLGRVKEAIFQTQRANADRVVRVLLQRIWNHPLVRHQHFRSIAEIETWAEGELKAQIRADNLLRLQQWRQDMRQSMPKATAWVKKQNTLPVTSVYEESYQGGAATTSNHESLKAIEAFWGKIWNRDRPDPHVAFQQWRQHAPNGPPLAWANITAEELSQQALRQRGSAPGPDGFTGSEVGFWPLKSWQIFEQLLQRWAARGETPEVWSSVRQVHLQKPDATLRTKDLAIAAKDMRPISVQCVIWRIVASAWTRRASTRAWVRSWVHRSACGGLPGKGVAEAIDTLLQQFEKPSGQSSVLVSLDYQKCFDCVDTKLGILCLRHLGCPAVMLAFLEKIWCQQRWLTYQNEYLPNPVFVSASMPQGDAVSPLTLLAIITGLTCRVLAQNPQPHTLVTYLDDRNFVARGAMQAARLWTAWKDASAIVGLWENDSKVKVVPRKASLNTQLLEFGFEERHLATTARVLGVDFTARLGSADRRTQNLRLRQSRLRIERTCLLPVSHQVRAQLVASLAIPKAVWGCWTSLAPVKQLSTLVRKVAGSKHNCTSVELFYLLAGHGLHAEFCAGLQAYSYLAQVVRRRARPWPQRSPQGTWLGTVRSWLASLGWSEQRPWLWQHPNLGARGFQISWTSQLSEPDLQREKHELRESWRRQLFSDFMASGRRDAAAVQGAAYSESRMTLARNTFRELDTHGRAVMAGAVVSDARFNVMCHEDIQPCTWCDDPAAVPDWDHLAWSCSGFQSTRPPVPSDNLQKVMGWPVNGNENDLAVVAHLASVRSKLLDRRYRSA
jgi:hypothetical protein